MSERRQSEDSSDFQALGSAFMALYLQGLNGVVCDPDAEPGRYGCSSCLDAWKTGLEILHRYDPRAGNMYRRGPLFQPSFGGEDGRSEDSMFDPADPLNHADWRPLLAERDRYREALGAILDEVGSSTLAAKIAREALDAA